MARALALLTMAGMLAMALAWAGDESLPDPTLPPAVVMQSAAVAAGASGPAAPVLHTVILRAGAKPAAVIGNQLVELGGRYGDDKLIKVSAGEVVLNGPGGRQVLRLVPGVDKTMTGGKMKPNKSGAKK